MRSHVAKTVSACFMVLTQLQSVRQSLPRTQIRSPVADVVTRPVTTGRQRNPGWHSVIPSAAAPVGHELGSATRVLFVEVRPHHSSPPATALAESTGEDPVQA